MPNSRRVSLRHPNRLNRPHSGQSLDPTLTRKGIFAHPGSFVIALAGIAFFAYAFNLGGLQRYIDGAFGRLDANVRSHNGVVARYVVIAFPYVAVAVGALFLFFILSMIGSIRSSAAPPKLKAAKGNNQPEAASAPAAQEIIKPMRLPVRELDMKPRSSQPGAESPAAD